jgi:hypothetical protein
MRKWYCDEGDVCESLDIVGELIAFLEHFIVRSVVMRDSIASCPHEY